MVKWLRQGPLWAAGLAGALMSLPAAAHAQCNGGACGGGGEGSCGAPACKGPCPPKFIWIYEGKPKLKFKCGCPRPVCDPCQLEHFGYYPVCWAPWPYPPDWSHCPVPPPGAVLPPPSVPPFTPKHRYYRDGGPYEDDRSTDEPRLRPGDSPTPRKKPVESDDLPPPKKIEKGGSVYLLQPGS